MAKKAAQKKPTSTVEFIDVPQNSDEWFKARLGLPTASRFADIMAQGEDKMRTRYLRDLAGEQITGRPAENFKSQAMDRGHEVEDEACEQFARTRFDVTKVGFVKNSGVLEFATVGCSPDRLVGSEGILEVKSMMPALLIELLEKKERGGSYAQTHYAQLQGILWVTERKWAIIKFYYPGMPKCEFEVKRDEKYIAEMASAVEVFCHDLKKLVKWLNAKKEITR